MSEMDVLVKALDQLLRGFEAKRRRSPVEPPVHLTGAYIKLTAAYGFARLGDRARAEATIREGVAAFDKEPEDPVHGFLVAAFIARVEMAIAGCSQYMPLPAEILDRRAALGNVPGYKASRVWEVSWVLSPGSRRESAVALFSGAAALERTTQTFARYATADVLAAQISEHLESSTSLELEPTIRQISGCLGALVDLPEAQAMPILMRAAELIDALPAPPLDLRIAMLLVIGRFGWGELVPLMFDSLAAQLAALAPDQLDPRLGATLQVLRRLDLREPLRRVLADFESLIDSAPGLAGPRMALAGALSLVDDPRGQAMFEAARARLKHPATVPQRVQLTRELANGYALASIPTAIAGIEKLLVQWKDITDSYGTNTHLCLTALEFADALIFGLTEARLGRGAP